jgi:hypothetical protein
MEQKMMVMTFAVPRGVPGTRGGRGGKGKWIRKVTIRRFTGRDEQLLSELPAGMPLHSKVVMLLERITTFDDSIHFQHGALIKKLSLGDRTFILLSARKLMIGGGSRSGSNGDDGDTLWCTTKCPSCSSTMSLNLSVSSLQERQQQAAARLKPSRDYAVAACGFKMRVRPLTAEDQDMIVRRRASTRDAVVQGMARASIVHAKPLLPEKLPESLLEAIGRWIEEADPLSDIVLSLSCPECSYTFSASFPVEEFVLRELGIDGQQLEREVHWLAFHYHWSENEILSLSTAKRKRYVELVNATLAGESI